MEHMKLTLGVRAKGQNFRNTTKCYNGRFEQYYFTPGHAQNFLEIHIVIPASVNSLV